MASKIKIKVIDKKSDFRLRLPGIPFWLVNCLISIGFKFKNIAIRNMDYLDNDARLFLQHLDTKMIKDLIHELKINGQFDLVDLSTGDGTIVKISIL